MAGISSKGLDPKTDIKTNTGISTDHSIFTFFNDIQSLAEGVYKWDSVNNKFIKQ
jgi:hypothetical protein